MVKNLPANVGSIPESGRSPEAGNWNPLQYSRLEDAMDRAGYSPWGRKESGTNEGLSTGTHKSKLSQVLRFQ